MHVICIFKCNNVNSSAVSVKLAEMQFMPFLNMPLSSCKFKYNEINKLGVLIKWYEVFSM